MHGRKHPRAHVGCTAVPGTSRSTAACRAATHAPGGTTTLIAAVGERSPDTHEFTLSEPVVPENTAQPAGIADGNAASNHSCVWCSQHVRTRTRARADIARHKAASNYTSTRRTEDVDSRGHECQERRGGPFQRPRRRHVGRGLITRACQSLFTNQHGRAYTRCL